MIGCNGIKVPVLLGVRDAIFDADECDLLYLLDLPILPKSGKPKFFTGVVPALCNDVAGHCSG